MQANRPDLFIWTSLHLGVGWLTQSFSQSEAKRDGTSKSIPSCGDVPVGRGQRAVLRTLRVGLCAHGNRAEIEIPEILAKGRRPEKRSIRRGQRKGDL